ncbi:MAG: DUF1559 domain-containing protein [Planctomycetes bacterium]|nr:DUF1559 domain-containing protein [Planctomycetota bacterium]
MSSFLNTRCRGFCGLCWFMTVLMAMGPSVAIGAEQAKQSAVGNKTLLAAPTAKEVEPLELGYVMSNAAAIVVARPRQLLTSEVVQMMPIEVVSAAGLQYLGFDPVNIKQIVVSATPPMAGPPLYSAIVEFTKPIDLAGLSEQITNHTVPGDINGKPYLKSQHPFLPSFAWATETTLLIAPDATLRQLLRNKAAPRGALVEQLAASNSSDDLLISVDLDTLRPLIQMGLAKATEEVPAEFQPFLELPNLLKQVQLRGSLSGAGPLELTADANSSEDADRTSELIDQALTLYGETAAAAAASMLAEDDPVMQAIGRYQLRVMPIWVEQLKPKRDGERFTIFHSEDVGEHSSQLTNIAVIGVLVGLLLPAVQAAREAARRNASMNNMKNITLALHNYADRHRGFPAHANYDEAGKPLLSWRVHLLPFLEEQKLYEQFHLDEPWDSEHNRQLISQMPELFLDPSSKHSPEDGKTHYLGAKGEGLAFSGTEKGRHFAGILDGTANTLMLLQVNDQRVATWTKPEDWELDPKDPLKGLAGSMHPGIFMAGFFDAHIQAISENIDPEVFQHMLTISGREVIPRD